MRVVRRSVVAQRHVVGVAEAVAVELVTVGRVALHGRLELVLVLGVVVRLLELAAVGFCTLSANISDDSVGPQLLPSGSLGAADAVGVGVAPELV